MAPPLLQIQASSIQMDGVEVDFSLSTAWLDRALRDSDLRAASGQEAGGRVSGRLSRSGNDIVVRCQITVAVEASCVRCLDPVPVGIESPLSLLLQPQRNEQRAAGRREQVGNTTPQDIEYEFSSAEAELDVYDGETVVLDAFVREAILLDVPNFPLCSETCPGIRPRPDASGGLVAQPPTVDPRLAPLGAFRQKMGGGTVTVDDLVAAAAERSAALGSPKPGRNKKPMLRANSWRGPRKKKNRK